MLKHKQFMDTFWNKAAKSNLRNKLHNTTFMLNRHMSTAKLTNWVVHLKLK